MSYKDIKVKGSTGRYTDEFKEAVKGLIREGKNYKEIADLFGIDSINSGYRQLIWKLQRDVHHSVEVKQLKANNTNTEDTSKVSEDAIAEKSDEIILPTAGGGMSMREKKNVLEPECRRPTRQESLKRSKELCQKAIAERAQETVKDSEKLHSSEVSEELVPNAGVAPRAEDIIGVEQEAKNTEPKAEEIVETIMKEAENHRAVLQAPEKILPSPEVLSLVSDLDRQVYNITRLLSAKQMEVALLETNLVTLKEIRSKLVEGFLRRLLYARFYCSRFRDYWFFYRYL